MTAEQRLILKYAALALAAFAVGCATALVPQLMDPSVPPLNWRIVIGTGITALVTAYGAALLPRKGSTDLARQVNDLRDQGVHRADMVVMSKDEAVTLAAELPPVHPDLAPDETDQLLTLIRTVTPKRAIVVLQDALYRGEGAP